MNIHNFFVQIVPRQEALNIVKKKKDFGNDFEIYLKSLHSSDDFDFQIIYMNKFKITQI